MHGPNLQVGAAVSHELHVSDFCDDSNVPNLCLWHTLRKKQQLAEESLRKKNLVVRKIWKVTEFSRSLNNPPDHHFVSLLKQMKWKMREREQSIVVIEYWKDCCPGLLLPLHFRNSQFVLFREAVLRNVGKDYRLRLSFWFDMTHSPACWTFLFVLAQSADQAGTAEAMTTWCSERFTKELKTYWTLQKMMRQSRNHIVQSRLRSNLRRWCIRPRRHLSVDSFFRSSPCCIHFWRLEQFSNRSVTISMKQIIQWADRFPLHRTPCRTGCAKKWLLQLEGVWWGTSSDSKLVRMSSIRSARITRIASQHNCFDRSAFGNQRCSRSWQHHAMVCGHVLNTAIFSIWWLFYRLL